MKQNEEQEYALGTHDEELVRLGMQHKLWSASAFDIWERARVSPGVTVLDLGCGPGYTSVDLAGLVSPGGKVIAIDGSARFINHLRSLLAADPNLAVEPRVADVHEMDFPEASVDVAFERWVLCFVKDPGAVIRNVARALKPGGTFALQDYMHYEGVLLAPHSEPFNRFMKSVAAAWRDHGGDPQVGLRLPSLLVENGLTPIDIRPLHRMARPQSQFWTWPSIFIKSYAPKLVAEGRLAPEDHDALVADWQARTNNPSAFFCSPPMVEILAVKQ